MTSKNEVKRLSTRFDELWPITRSITGSGFRKSVEVLKQDIPLSLHSKPSGTEIFDWEIPPEWNVNTARLVGPDGTVYADLDQNNLAIVNYSEPIDKELSLESLEPHLYTLPELPNAIPYVTSYYERNWGFCLPHNVYESLPDGEYHAYIDSELDPRGELNYAHALLEGESDREILLSTYLCHPSLANNELSGPLVMTSLYRRISEWDNRKFTYRFVIVPETIGSLSYLFDHGQHLQDKLVSGLVLTCLGGPKESISYKSTRRGDALIDKVINHMDEYMEEDIRLRPFDTKGSDERQYNSPGFNLPVGQIARTIYGEYDEYHTSLDTKNFMGIRPLIESANIIEKILETTEYSGYYINQKPYGEPMMSKRNLYSSINDPSSSATGVNIDNMMRVLNFSDGDHSAVEIANRYDIPVGDLEDAIRRLCDIGLLEPAQYTPSYRTQFGLNDR